MSFDRQKQKILLEDLLASYPSTMKTSHLNATSLEMDEAELVRNLVYLKEHGLVNLTSHENLSGNVRVAAVKITAKGIDFLQDDGGLGAILSVQTIRFEDKELRDALIKIVEGSTSDTTLKSSLLTTIKQLPSEALKQVFSAMVGQGILMAPEALSKILQAVSSS